MPKISSRSTAVRQHIDARIPFQTYGALMAISRSENAVGKPLPFTGQLPMRYVESAERASYVVYSYSTPIAWWSEEDGWTRPEVKYSRTTSVHQGKCPRG